MHVEGRFRGFHYTVSYRLGANEAFVIWSGPRNWYEEMRRGATIWASAKIDMPIEEFWDKLDIGRSTTKTD